MNQERSKWLHEEKEEMWGGKSGEDKNQGQNLDFQHDKEVQCQNRMEVNNSAIIVGNLNKKG